MNKYEKKVIQLYPELQSAVRSAQHTIASQRPVVRRVALDPEIATLAQARIALRPIPISDRGSLASAAAGVRAVFQALDQLERVQCRIDQQFKADRSKRWYNWNPLCHPAQRAVRKLRMGPEALRENLELHRREAVWGALCRLGYRTAAHGDFYIGFGSAAVRQEEYADWDMYAKSYGHPGRVQNSTLIVPADWRVRIERRGLAALDGLLTLDAVLLDSRVVGEGVKENFKIYAAVWLAQGRGTELHIESGFIAVGGEKAYHSMKSPDDAARGLLRKIRAAAVDIVLGRESLADLVEKSLRIDPDLTVKWADAKAVGACTPGIISWCRSVGIDPDAAAIPLRTVYAAYCQVPATEARATMLHVLRSNAAVRRALVAAM